MPRYVGNPVNTMVQVLNSSGDPVTDAIVNYKVYKYDSDDESPTYETWIVFDAGLMAHIGDGVYQAEWTPNSNGEYTFYAYSTSPKFHEAYTYFIEASTIRLESVYAEQENVQSYMASGPLEIVLTGHVRILNIKVYQTHDDGNIDKTISSAIESPDFNSGSGSNLVPNRTAVANGFRYMFFDAGLTSANLSSSFPNPSYPVKTLSAAEVVNPTNPGLTQIGDLDVAQGCTISIRFNDVAGTNQKIMLNVTYYRFGN